MSKEGKLLIFSAPSGSGKSTLVNYIMSEMNDMKFSISATNRKPRGTEKDGVEYHFLTTDEFRKKIEDGDFVEWEEVYDGRYYGTLKSEVNRIRKAGYNVVFDVDVIGGLNIKKMFKDEALAIFVQPPDLHTLKKRLVSRGTDNDEDIATRIEKAEFEMTFSDQFDVIIVNDDLEKAKKETLNIVNEFIER